MWDYVKRILPWSVIIREDSHSHPNNSTYPSGILDRSDDIELPTVEVHAKIKK